MSDELKELLEETFDNQEYADQLKLTSTTACGCKGCTCASE
jgi:hypothetical protein